MTPFLRRLAVNSGRPALTLVIVIAAVIAGRFLWASYQEAPWTRDGRVRADVVTIAPDVSGLVSEVSVKDNQTVKRGDTLFSGGEGDNSGAPHRASADQNPEQKQRKLRALRFGLRRFA